MLAGLAAVLLWDAAGLDLAMAHWFGSASGFAWRDNLWGTRILHDGAQRAGWVFMLCLTLAIFWPVGALRRLTRTERGQMVLLTLLALTAIAVIKGTSRTSCPWDLAEFGGQSLYVSHWALGVRDGGGGHCFPAGHASTGFAMLAGYFSLRDKAPRAARIWLVTALVLGFCLGLVQQVRGAHFMSHTLWTAWICWTVAGVAHLLLQQRAARRKASTPALP